MKFSKTGYVALSFQKEMRSRYEYETGKLIGMNQAYVKQNGEMRKRIEAQNKRIEEVSLFRCKYSLFKLNFDINCVGYEISKKCIDFRSIF